MNTEAFCSLTDLAQVQLGRHHHEVGVPRVDQRLQSRPDSTSSTTVEVLQIPVVEVSNTFTAVGELFTGPNTVLTVNHFVEAVTVLKPFSESEDLVGRTHRETGRASVTGICAVVHGGVVGSGCNHLRISGVILALAHRQNTSGAHLYRDRSCGDVSFINNFGNALVNSSVGCCLNIQVEGGHDFVTTTLEVVPTLILGCSEGFVVFDDPGDVVTEECGSTSSLATSAGRGDDRCHRFCNSCLVFLLSDLAFSKHALKDVVSTVSVCLNVFFVVNTEVVWVIDRGNQACCLGKCEVFRFHAEVVLSCSFDSVGSTTEGSNVQITIENFIFRVLRLNADGQLHFFELSLNACLGSSDVGSLTGIRVCELFSTLNENVLHILLADG